MRIEIIVFVFVLFMSALMMLHHDGKCKRYGITTDGFGIKRTDTYTEKDNCVFFENDGKNFKFCNSYQIIDYGEKDE